MAAFDPDAYLAQKASAPVAFDPDAYLASKAPAARSLVSQIPTERGANLTPTPQAPVSLIDKIYGAAEVFPAMAGGMVGGVVTPIAQLGYELFGGQAFTPQGRAAAAEFGKKVQGQFYQPRTEQGQKYTAAIGNALAPLVGVPIPTLNAFGQSVPAAARAIRDVGRSEANLIGGAIAVPLEARAARIQEGRVAQSYANAPIIDATKAAERQGLAMDPAVTNPTMRNRFKGMLVGKAFDEAALTYNAAQATKVVRQDLGVAPTEKLNVAAIDRALDVAGKPYDVIRKMGVLQTPQTSLNALESLRTPALIGGEQSAAAVGSLIDDAINKLQQGRSGALLLDDIRSNRRNANAVYKAESVNPDPLLRAKADAQMAIANILEDIVDANAPNSKALSEMKTARVRMAQIFDHERAINFANETVDPQVYAKLLDEKKGGMTGVGADLGKVAATVPNLMNTQAPVSQVVPKVTRSGLLSAGGALAGGAVAGYPGAIGGAGVGGASGWIGSRLAAKGMVTPEYQASRAMPTDYRPAPNMLRPVEPSYSPNALVPYDYSQSVLTPDQIPNFVLRPSGPGPLTTPGVAPGPAQIGMSQGPVGGQMGALRIEDVRARDLSMRQGAAVEAQQAAAAATGRQPTGQGISLMFDSAGNLVEVPIGGSAVSLAPTSLESAVQKLSGQVIEQPSTSYTTRTISPKSGAKPYIRIIKTEGEPTFERGVSRAFDLTVEERIAWEKTKVGLATAAPEFKGLTDKALASKLMDQKWIQDTITKAREKARGFDEIAVRGANNDIRRAAVVQREILQDGLDALEETLRRGRPVSGTGQGPKTRAARANQLSPREVTNAMEILGGSR